MEGHAVVQCHCQQGNQAHAWHWRTRSVHMRTLAKKRRTGCISTAVLPEMATVFWVSLTSK
jgi:hypothetical protein